ncbi:response regulator transcription factor [Cytophagaceae bacterium DM2B3-1]|uniref:Response regulator transcription factor n=1 Tax=Xanthocytophaga flava TaxID=3048013 RepID=A0AAE3QQ72_9BACT|nr:response regulator transcription factor [Xanthocytophaga flavus]MDJ1466799.1 response regulator transcription factor [Xanthocytophaga flavus]MDJ1482871.1 response regulator transcription factor [Xanthocytophaga flavus]MDJ1496139.1 response regulator transcription factor [Xanthocytophaga flavus]
MKILIVEDEVRLATFIQKGLEENAHLVDIANDGEAGLQLAFGNEYDVIVADVNMPKLNGYAMTQALRNENQQTPILMLTAMGSLADKATGYAAGIDDFLVKPFQFEELLMRLTALHRRSSFNQLQSRKNLLKVADLEMDLTSRIVQRGGKYIALTAKEYMLLEYLMRNRNRIVSRIDIADRVWDANMDPASNTIDTYINFLRKKIDHGQQHKLIHTIIGMGYSIQE